VHYSALYASFELKKCYYKSSLSFMYLCHRVDRVLGFFNPVLRIGTPHPFTRRRVCPPLLFRERGWGGGPNSDDGIDTVVLYVGIWELCARNSFRTIFYAVKHKIGDFSRFFEGDGSERIPSIYILRGMVRNKITKF
jgi:hypothetical protein